MSSIPYTVIGGPDVSLTLDNGTHSSMVSRPHTRFHEVVPNEVEYSTDGAGPPFKDGKLQSTIRERAEARKNLRYNATILGGTALIIAFGAYQVSETVRTWTDIGISLIEEILHKPFSPREDIVPQIPVDPLERISSFDMESLYTTEIAGMNQGPSLLDKINHYEHRL